MKESVQELTAGDTTTAVAGFDSIVTGVVGKVWLNELLEAAKKKMFFEQFAYVSTCPKGNKDLAIPLFSSNLDFSITTTEATTRVMTQIDNLTTVVFTPSTQKMGVAISSDVVRTSQVDTVKFAREQLVYDAALNIDAACDTILQASTTNAVIYGPSRNNRAALVAGDILTTDIIAQANRVLKAIGWYPEPDKPFVLFISAAQEEALLKDSQFVNASEYGGNEIVMNGEIGRYLGIKVISTQNITSFADGGGSTYAGHFVYLLKAKVAYGLVYGEKPKLDFEYVKNEATYNVYLDMAYEAKVLQGGALQVIEVLDA
jgi:N4-gp56 family major capsid protein